MSSQFSRLSNTSRNSLWPLCATWQYAIVARTFLRSVAKLRVASCIETTSGRRLGRDAIDQSELHKARDVRLWPEQLRMHVCVRA